LPESISAAISASSLPIYAYRTGSDERNEKCHFLKTARWLLPMALGRMT